MEKRSSIGGFLLTGTACTLTANFFIILDVTRGTFTIHGRATFAVRQGELKRQPLEGKLTVTARIDFLAY